MIALCASIFFLSFILSLILTVIVKKIALAVDFVDRPEERKVHTTAMPLGGGIAIFFSVFLTVAAGFFIASYLKGVDKIDFIPRLVYDNLNGILRQLPRIVVIFAGAAALFIIGLIDDRYGIHARAKLIIQFIVAVAVAASGIRVTLFIGIPAVSWIITILWIVTITNAFNLMDNMDGLSGGVAFIISAILLAVAVETGQVFVAALLLAVMGGILGFLVFNFPPARIFMGDSGALFIGYILSIITILFTFISDYRENRLFPILMPLIIFSIPLYDMLSVICIRLREGRSIFQPDKKHFSHRLTRLGMTKREAVLSVYLVTFSLSIAGTLLHYLTVATSVTVLVQVTALLLVIAVLESAGKRGKNDDR